MLNAFRVLLCNNVIYAIIFIGGILFYSNYLKMRQNEKLEMARLKAFLGFLDSVSYQYTLCHCVEEAVLMCMESSDANLTELLEEMYQILIDDDKEKLKSYQKDCQSKFYFQFLVYAYLAMEYGDTARDSVFLSNILFLKKQIFIWILDREKLWYRLCGLAGMVLIPIQFLKGIELWAEWNLRELGKFYSGAYGFITRFFLVFITIICYQVVMGLRVIHGVRFYQSTVLYQIARNKYIREYYERWLEYHPTKVYKLSLLLRASSSRMSLQEFWVLRRFLAVIAGFTSFVMLSPIIQIHAGMLVVAALIICLTVLFLYWLPVWYLKIRIYTMRKQKEDEIYFFYGIVFLVVFNGDVDSVLEWILIGSDILEPAIELCLDQYTYDSEMAIKNAKEEEMSAPFVKMMDAFLVSESIGLQQAIIPLQMELEQFLEKRKQEDEIATANKGVIGAFVAFIPMICIIILYLIVPFVLESLYQLREYVKQIQIGL